MARKNMKHKFYLIVFCVVFILILCLSNGFTNENTKLNINNFTVNLYTHNIKEKELNVDENDEYILYTVVIESQKENLDKNIYELEMNDTEIIDVFSENTLDDIFTNYVKKDTDKIYKHYLIKDKNQLRLPENIKINNEIKKIDVVITY